MLKEIQIGEELIDLNEVDFIAINQIKDDIAGLCHCITFFTKQEEDVVNCFKSQTIRSVAKNWEQLCNFMQENCPQFFDFNTEFLINANNVRDISVNGKVFGENALTIAFKDGVGYDLYTGLTRMSAKEMKGAFMDNWKECKESLAEIENDEMASFYEY